jgi:hypothetical protein
MQAKILEKIMLYAKMHFKKKTHLAPPMPNSWTY